MSLSASLSCRRAEEPVKQAEGRQSRSEKPQVQEMSLILNDAKTWQERVRATRELPEKMADKDLQALLETLEQPLPETGKESSLVTLNEIMGVLRSKGLASREYGLALSRLITGPDTDSVVRDYAVQHGIGWMSDYGAGEATTSDREVLLYSISIMLEESANEGSSWGTALNGLRNLRRLQPDAQDIPMVFAALSKQIDAVARGSQPAIPANRVAAIQALGYLPDQQQSHALLAELLRSSDRAVLLPTVAVMGEMGETSDIQVLQSIAEKQPPLSFAVRSAVTKIKKRHNP